MYNFLNFYIKKKNENLDIQKAEVTSCNNPSPPTWVPYVYGPELHVWSFWILEQGTNNNKNILKVFWCSS